MELPEIKTRLDILTVLGRYKLQPDRHDMLVCPFHQDKKPSMKVYRDTNTFFCFSCGVTGDAIQFIEFYEKISKGESIRKAISLTGTVSSIATQPETQIKEKDLLPRLAVLSKIAQDSKASFKRNNKAQEYLKQRGLNPDKMDVGYISEDFGKGWNHQLQESGLLMGILRKSRFDTVVPKFKNCVLFFSRNEKGQIIDIYGRSIMDNSESSPAPIGSGKHFYLNGHHLGLYPKYPDAGTKKLILTESIIDSETLLQQEEIREQYSLIALFGTNGFTPEIQQAIQQLPELEEVILFFDGDQAGEKAVIKHAQVLENIKPGIKITTVKTPQGEDINSLVQGHESEILLHLIRERTPVGKETGREPAVPLESEPPECQVAGLDTANPQKLIFKEGDLQFTIWGGVEKEGIHRLKINLSAELTKDSFRYYQDDVNLYSNGQLQRYIRGSAEQLEYSTTALKIALRKLQTHLEEYRLKLLEEERKALKPKTYQMSRDEELRAMNFLKANNLVKNTLTAIEKSGLVGERENSLLLFFLYLSRLLDEPLHAIIYGKSGSGKTYLQTKISECLPDESVRTITSLTENTLYYSAKDFWKHKVLLIEDLEGVYNAFLPLREFMSKQSITKLTTDKDSKGNNVQKVLFVEGPICVSGATTQGNIYEDNANRSFLLHVDETTQHMQQVMDYQRKIQAGLIDEKEQDGYRQTLKNAQRLLRQIKVINPYAPQLEIPTCVFKKLRTNMHYLKLIEIITFYHQYQREWKKDSHERPYIETSLEDIECANSLVKDTLLRKSDELSGELRSFFESLKYHLSTDKAGLQSQSGKEEKTSFYAKDIRKHFRMHPQKLSRYLLNLEQRGLIKRVNNNRQTGYEYEVISWDDYQVLKNDVDILDRILEKLKSKNSKS